MYYKFAIYLLCLPTFCISFEYFSIKNVNSIFYGVKEIVNSKQDKITNLEDDGNLNIKELAKKYKYDIEEHIVTTEDGYILNIHRLPARGVKFNSPIFLMHGILDSSDSWVLQGPRNAIAYILADRGYDVWMGNARGNKYSYLHTKLNKNQSDYWKFSWDEIGVYDLPAMIDYILNTTGKSSLYYIGHSQGTTTFFVMTSLKPDYNRKIKMVFALSPIAWMSHAKSPAVKILANLNYLLNINMYTSSTEFLSKLEKYIICGTIVRCDNILQFIIGNDYKLINSSLMPIISKHVPSTSSILQFVHYGQVYLSGNFCRFDFGPSENLNRYGLEVPPFYNLENITVPVVLFYSNNDWLSDVEDVSILYNKLRNVYNTYYLKNFNHFDFMYANVAKYVIYENIVREIIEFESGEE